MSTYGFSSTTFSWSEYTRYRPAYPASLWSLILDYHRSHNGHFDSAHDIGAGAGIAASSLASHFSHVYVSDPSTHNLSNAREALAQLKTSAPPDSNLATCEFSFSQTPAEEPWLPPSSVDLTTCFQALHWTDTPKAIAVMAASLKTGGTLALLHYGPRVYIPENPRAEAAWNRIMDAHSRHIRDTPGDPEGGRRAHPLGDLGLDYVRLPVDLFAAGARRIYINTAGRGRHPFAKSKSSMEEMWFPPAAVGVQEGETNERWQNREDWGGYVDADWFKGYVDTLQPQFNLHVVEDAFGELEDAIGDGTVLVLWSVAIVLATKR